MKNIYCIESFFKILNTFSILSINFLTESIVHANIQQTFKKGEIKLYFLFKLISNMTTLKLFFRDEKADAKLFSHTNIRNTIAKLKNY